MSDYVHRKIKLTNLLVNTENPRFEDVGNQIEAIENMIKDQAKTNNNKLYNLAQDMANSGLNPSDLPIVCPDKDRKNMFVVLEGNRRVTALKLLFQPDLIPIKYPGLLKKFKELNKKSDLSPFEEINCVVFTNPEDADHWIEIKHTGEMDGIGTVRWDSKQQERFEAKTRHKSISLQTLELIERSDVFDEKTKRNASSIAITNLSRLLNDPDVRAFIGIDTERGEVKSIIPKEEVAKGLTKIINDLATKEINVNDIYYKDDRRRYLETFKDEDIPQKVITRQWYFNEVDKDSNDDSENENGVIKEDAGSLQKRMKSKPLSIKRKYLIPGDCIIRIEDKRINSIYREMKELEVDKFRNAAAVIIRVFVELSVDYFINKKSIASVSANDKLVKKIEGVASYLKTNKILDKKQLKPVNTAISSPNSVLSTETLNAYVHNRNIHPNPKDLKLAWDNIEHFIKTILTN